MSCKPFSPPFLNAGLCCRQHSFIQFLVGTSFTYVWVSSCEKNVKWRINRYKFQYVTSMNMFFISFVIIFSFHEQFITITSVFQKQYYFAVLRKFVRRTTDSDQYAHLSCERINTSRPVTSFCHNTLWIVSQDQDRQTEACLL